MQLPVLGCTFLTLSECEESTAENRQLSEQRSAPIIRALRISAQHSAAHKCPSVHPPVPSSAPTCAQQCHPAVPPTCAQKCHLPVPSSATHMCPPVQPTYAH
ncbi:unnamed protein product [Staurois parvus]|uniref:Uncharacterized protein n=1 Tax=Staurois parvus TaxID=386267 RepID=A0ABN9DKE5_9NEOB|nr:unnamed protein product [Staurois parvus]